jgi:hypothetical protein
MNTIRMVDLYGQYLKIKTEIDNAMQEVIASSVFIKGGKVDVLEQKLAEYLGSNVVTCGNGTDALQLIFMALGLQPGDEVITSPFTFVATAEVLAFMKLKPVFVDVDPQTFNLDASKIEAAITPTWRLSCGFPNNITFLLLKMRPSHLVPTSFFRMEKSKRAEPLGLPGQLHFSHQKHLGVMAMAARFSAVHPKWPIPSDRLQIMEKMGIISTAE